MARRFRRTRSHGRRRGRLPLVNLVPNIVTLAALAAGFTAIRFALMQEYERAVLLVLLAAMLDTLDGFLARRLGSDSALGAELDSLADFLDFGVAPALILYLWALHALPQIGWIAVLVYVICTALRLARFNILAREAERPPDHFIGVPAPAGALLVLAPMFFSFALADRPAATPPLPPALLALVPIFVGLLMISRLRTWSFKSVTIRRDKAPFVILGILTLGAAALTFPWQTLSVVALGYAASLLWCLLRSDRPRPAAPPPSDGDGADREDPDAAERRRADHRNAEDAEDTKPEHAGQAPNGPAASPAGSIAHTRPERVPSPEAASGTTAAASPLSRTGRPDRPLANGGPDQGGR